ncbi:MAG: hypothetical protein JW843_02835 [Candidatus Aminicenantes bacterium]|nr:hypothetical protein [Candidatus Aminicenantes bacterium]
MKSVLLRVSGLMISAFMAAGSLPAQTAGRGSVQVTALVFETAPMIYTVTKSEPDPSGAVRGRMTGGMITSQFPPAVMRMKIGGSEDFNIEAVPALIKRHFKFQCGDEVSEGLPAKMIGKDIFSGKDGTFKKIGHSLLTTGNPLKPETDPVLFDLKLVSRQGETFVFEACCVAGPVKEAESDGRPAALLEEIIGLRPNEPVLIGFPYINRAREKFVYWIALLLE